MKTPIKRALKNCGNGSILVRFFRKNRKRCVRASRLRKIHIFKKNPLPTVKNHKITIPKHPTDWNYLQRRPRNYFWHFITFSSKSQKIVFLSRLPLKKYIFRPNLKRCRIFLIDIFYAEFNSNHTGTSKLAVA